MLSMVVLIASRAPTPFAEPLKAEAGEIEALLDATDDLNRGRSSHSVMKMKVKTDRYEREMKIEAWTKGQSAPRCPSQATRAWRH